MKYKHEQEDEFDRELLSVQYTYKIIKYEVSLGVNIKKSSKMWFRNFFFQKINEICFS